MTISNISVIVPFYNAADTLSLCLESLEAQEERPFEVILVDNNSTDRSASIAKNFTTRYKGWYRCITEKKQGPTFARNAGAKQAGGDIIAFTDADCITHPNWLRSLAGNFDAPNIGAVAGKTAAYEHKTSLDKFHALYTLQGLKNDGIFSEFLILSGGFPTANLAVRKDIFEAINGFDESIKIYSEDYDLCARIYQSGYKIKYTNQVIVYHKHRTTLKGTWKQSYGFGSGHVINLKRHFSRLLIFEVPKFRYMSQRYPLRAWVDLAAADKKMMAIVLLALIWWPMVFGLPIYTAFLYRQISVRLQRREISSSAKEKCLLVALLLFKSFALTSGRVVGAIKHRIFCF